MKFDALISRVLKEELSRTERIQAAKTAFKDNIYRVYRAVHNNVSPRKSLIRFKEQASIEADSPYRAYDLFLDYLRKELGDIEKLKDLQTADLEFYISPSLDSVYVDLQYYNNLFKFLIVGPGAPYGENELQDESVRDKFEDEIANSSNV